MPAAEARIQTSRASRYLTQLCGHVQSVYSKRGPLRRPRHKGMPAHAGGRPAEPPRVEWTETRGTISFGDAVITLQASQDALILHAEAASEESLRRAQERVTGLLARFGRRDQLSVAWRHLGAAS